MNRPSSPATGAACVPHRKVTEQAIGDGEVGSRTRARQAHGPAPTVGEEDRVDPEVGRNRERERLIPRRVEPLQHHGAAIGRGDQLRRLHAAPVTSTGHEHDPADQGTDERHGRDRGQDHAIRRRRRIITHSTLSVQICH